MIKLEHSERGVDIDISGTVLDIPSEIALVVGIIYNDFKKQGPLAAELFKRALQFALEDGSPAWLPDAPVDGEVCVINITKEEATK